MRFNINDKSIQANESAIRANECSIRSNEKSASLNRRENILTGKRLGKAIKELKKMEERINVARAKQFAEFEERNNAKFAEFEERNNARRTKDFADLKDYIQLKTLY